MDDEEIIKKYTGHRVSVRELACAASSGGSEAELAKAVLSAVHSLAGAEAELTRVGTWVGDAVSRTRAVIAAAQPTPDLNRLGELQINGPRFDMFVAVRAERISHLRQLLHLWSMRVATGTAG
jgi:hypothetical protein